MRSLSIAIDGSLTDSLIEPGSAISTRNTPMLAFCLQRVGCSASAPLPQSGSESRSAVKLDGG